MPTIDDLLHRRADRGAPRGATDLWVTASEPAYVLPGPSIGRRRSSSPLLVAAAAVLVVAAASLVVLSAGGDRSIAPLDRSPDVGAPAWFNDPSALPEGTAVVIAFLDLDDEAPLDRRRDELSEIPGVLEAHQIDRSQAYQEFQELFTDTDMIDAVTEDVLPESVHLLVAEVDAESVVEALARHPGVWRVLTAEERAEAARSLP